MKNKIIIFVIAVAICLSIFSISCFAVDFTIQGDTPFTFKEELDFTDATFSSFYFVFESSGVVYSGMQYSYRGYHVLSYLYEDEYNPGNYTASEVYHSGSGWVSDDYRTITLGDVYFFTNNFGTFLSQNEYIHQPIIYDTIYELVGTYIYGSTELTGYKELTAIILSTILCVAVFVLPFAVVFFVTKLILSAGDRFL